MAEFSLSGPVFTPSWLESAQSASEGIFPAMKEKSAWVFTCCAGRSPCRDIPYTTLIPPPRLYYKALPPPPSRPSRSIISCIEIPEYGLSLIEEGRCRSIHYRQLKFTPGCVQQHWFQKPNSWTYNFVEVSGRILESSQTWRFCIDLLNYREGGMVFYQVFLLSPLQCTVYSNWTVEPVRGCVSLKKYKSQGKAVEVTVNSKEENSEDLSLDFVQVFGLS